MSGVGTVPRASRHDIRISGRCPETVPRDEINRSQTDRKMGPAMKAVVVATGSSAPDDLGVNRAIPELRPLVCRPWIEHVIEYLNSKGIDRFHIIMSRSPEALRTVLGNGERWGVNITYHAVRDPDRPYDRLRHLAREDDTDNRLLLAHGASIPDLRGYPSLVDVAWKLPTVFFCSAEAEERGDAWTGYAVVTGEWAAKLPPGSDRSGTLQCLEKQLESAAGRRCAVERVLSADHHARALAANQAVIGKEFDDLLLKNNEIQEGVWISRNVILHPTARITPPVFIGPDCRIEKQVGLGPGAVIAPKCVIDRKATIQNSLILEESYVGENLEVNDSVVDRNRLVNTRIDAALSISENFLLGSLSKNLQPSVWRRLPSRLAGLLLLLCLLPLLPVALILAPARNARPAWHVMRYLCLPAGDDPRQWRTAALPVLMSPPAEDRSQSPVGDTSFTTFLLAFLPGLFAVVFGSLHLVGLPPRSPREVQALPEEWKQLYLAGKPGLITENLVVHNASRDSDDKYAAETFYAATASFKHDAGLLLRYLRKLFR